MNKDKPITICFLGSYDKNYSRNKILFQGLSEHGISIREVHAPVKITELNDKKHISATAIFYRIVRKFLILPITLKHIPQIASSDIIFVPYPAHLDIPLGWIVSKIFRIPLIIDPLFSLSDVFVNDFKIADKKSIFIRLLSLYEKWMFKASSLILIDTPFQQKQIADWFKIPEAKIQVVPLGADNKIYKVVHTKPYNNLFTVIYYGLYNPVHGVEYIIDAAKLLQEDTKIQFLMIGDGQIYPQIYKRVQEEKIQNVKFLKLKEKEALPYLAQAKVFLGLFGNSQSVFRTIPNKVLQGMALGKAVINAKGPAIESVFKSGTHLILIPPANGPALATAIASLKEDTRLRSRIEKEGHKIYLSQFTPYKVAETFINVLKTL